VGYLANEWPTLIFPSFFSEIARRNIRKENLWLRSVSDRAREIIPRRSARRDFKKKRIDKSL
jgi:hypothetical protein